DSIKYVNAKIKRASAIGIRAEIFRLPLDAPESAVLDMVAKLNSDASWNGIIVQLPLPGSMDARKIVRSVSPCKDVDGLNPASDFIPATTRGIEKLLEHYLYGENFDLAGKSAVVIGRSDLVGLPTAKILLRHNATVTVCHSKTPDLAKYTRGADILVSAAGRNNLIKPDMIKPGVVLIDVGTNGDIDPACHKIAAAYTPVPGGVGPMTIISLLENLVKSD
ncbi:MAG: bifunctional 5,10-methylenetetrahydrofolate dehydrogenase/5,10-methenyltetrahydrofolate cyclohydrolase, partial [Rickettsiales bacterium]|nr:bifunctional 5,10-methylenetetrahydrofolate dehydrogenase/5,10-methenyltetrahydrofolate cyclohydrolase [Rickettsiales bacterium]